MERLIQVLETASFQDGMNVGPFGEELNVKVGVEDKVHTQFASIKALLLSFPGAGSDKSWCPLGAGDWRSWIYPMEIEAYLR